MEKSDEMKEIEHELEKTLDEHERAEKPKVGMLFSSQEELFVYYKKFAWQEGFDVTRRSSKPGDDGKLKYLTFACARTGKSECKGKNLLKSKPVMKTQCKARINAGLRDDGRFVISRVILEHNHVLSPNKSRFHIGSRSLGWHLKRRFEPNDQAGISENNSLNPLVEAVGVENIPFGEKDSQNYTENAGRLRLGTGDAQAIRDYFSRMQVRNSNFFYVMDIDEDCRLRNVFWADARSRAAYEAFGDVVTFDTTYLTNKYNMPFVSFVGVNHHGQSILFGCGLVSNEDIETFVWLFESWLACMSIRAPNAIITDQCVAIQRAVEGVFSEARHRWCLWHIMKKILKKLRGHSQYESVMIALQNAVYGSFTEDEFEGSWERMIGNYNLQNDTWLGGLYDERRRWVPAYVKDTFWAGMSTMQQSEILNSFFDGYINSKTTLKQFLERYDNALRRKIEKENQADYNSFNSRLECTTHYDIEKQFQEAYTNEKFREIQEELRGKMYCYPSFVKEEGAISTYEVVEDAKFGERTKDLVFNVHFNEKECEVQCTCRLFEFRGILCRHAIALLTHKRVKLVPSKYILSRWRKDSKRKYTRVRISYDDFSGKPEAQRFDKMYNLFYELADLGSESDDRCMMVMTCLRELKEKLHDNELVCGSGHPTQNPSSASPICDDDLNMVSVEINRKMRARKMRERKRSQQGHENDKHKGKQKKGSAILEEVEKDGSNVPPPTPNTAHLINEGHPRQYWRGGYGMVNLNAPTLHGNQLQGHPFHYWRSGYGMGGFANPSFPGSQLQGHPSQPEKVDMLG